MGDQIGLTEAKAELLKKRLAKAKEKHTRASSSEMSGRSSGSLQPLTDGAPKYLSYAQRRLWFLEQFDENSASYNMYMVRKIQGRLERESFQKALKAVVDRHEALHCVYEVEGEEPVMKRRPELEVELREEDLSGFSGFSGIPGFSGIGSKQEEELKRRVKEEIGRPFKLERELPLRVRLYKLGEEEQALLVVIHHIACDAYSSNLFLNELAACYEKAKSGSDETPEPLPAQYADYAAWQREE
ncbi:MAG TPA: condensation domain-containing protein, partial [Bacillota bacterium]|nr:condensation domain-containing protein [Bacillota bacterium]